MSAANRNRGARAEVAVVNYLRAQGWPDARRYLAGDGRQPGDIDWHPLITLEVKDVAASAWPTWCRQAAAEARPGMVPVVVRRTRGVPDVGQWPVRLPLDNPLGLTQHQKMWPVVETPTCFWWVESTMAELVAAVKAVDDVTPTPTLPFDTTTDDLACAVAVLAQAADRAQRLASLIRTPDHWAWAERATRAHAAVVRLAESTEETA